MRFVSNRLLARLTVGMLSIGKVGLGRIQQLYYEQKVAKGAEDYYAGRGEAAGRWTGAGAALLGLAGELDSEQLKALMDGKDPRSGEQLATRTAKSTIAAFDLTFSAPKSVSVLFAVGDERLSRALVEAHEEAVDAAVSYIEQEACRVRRGHNGTKEQREAGDPRGWQRARPEPATGFVAAAYRHRMSRAQDPQLHTHVVCANMARGRDGRWTALDGRAIYDHAKAGGCVYEAHLRKAVRERATWVRWGPVREGIAELEAVPAGVREEFSQRRRRILERERELEAAGVTVGFDGRERIVYDTREAKQEIAEQDWRAEVRARAAEHGFGQRELDRVTRAPVGVVRPAASERELGSRLFSASGLTATQNTFQRRDVVVAVACEHPDGVSADAVLALSERMLEHPEVVSVSFGLDRCFTTRELLAAEELIVGRAEQGQRQGAGLLPEDAVVGTVERLPRPLSEEQRRVVLAVATSGNDIDTIEALAGTGKTTSAGAVKQAYQEVGYRVVGAAPTARGVRELKERAGIDESRTLDGWAVKLAAEPEALAFAQATATGIQRQPAVMIIDEAGMAHTRVAARVIERAIEANVKVVAIGDSGQLSSVRAGGWLGALTRRLGSHELRDVMRQRDPHERRALAKVHRGQPEGYLDLKRRRGELRIFRGEEPGRVAEESLVARWAAACESHGTSEAVMVCRDNARRERLNELVRAHRRELGELGESVEIGGHHWAVGDRVIARHNDRGRDLDNGTRGTVASVSEDGLMVRVDSGGVRKFERHYVERHVEHAYALTGHGMQGGTVGWAGVIGHPREFSRNWSYTALSRAREPVEVFLVDEQTSLETERDEIAPADRTDSPDPFERMRRRMRERDDEDLALEQLQHVGALAADGREEHSTAPAASPIRAMVYELDERLEAIREQLRSTAIDDATALSSLRETITAIERERDRDEKPHRPRRRTGYETRQRQREYRLTELREREVTLLHRTRDPDVVLKWADELREEQRRLGAAHHRLRAQAIDEELAESPTWLEHSLGPEPQDEAVRDRWRRAARELAGHRIDNRITDPHLGIGSPTGDLALQRNLAETRSAVGVQPDGPEATLARDR